MSARCCRQQERASLTITYIAKEKEPDKPQTNEFPKSIRKLNSQIKQLTQIIERDRNLQQETEPKHCLPGVENTKCHIN